MWRPCCCRRNMRLRGMLEHEAGTPQLWAAPDTARTGPSAAAALAGAPLWEMALLRKHYHPHVAQSAAVVAAIPPEGVCMPAETCMSNPKPSPHTCSR